MSTHRDAGAEAFGTENIGRLLLRIAPPVMAAQLIQALYNIVDSFFVGSYSQSGLTALSVIFPIQFIIPSLAIGTGIGVNTYMARMYATGKKEQADAAAGAGTVLTLFHWLLFSLLILLLLGPYVRLSARAESVINDSMTYGLIVCLAAPGIFLESVWTKIHQARGNMKRPMLAQIVGTITNIVLDPVLIWGLGPFPEMGIAGAAIATVAGQSLAAVTVAPGALRKPPVGRQFFTYARHIYRFGYPYILMQSTATVYIIVLNIILARFSDAAVTVLGLYYKYQSFFFIPLLALQTCIVPILSYNYAQKSYARLRLVIRYAIFISAVFMILGIICFCFFPVQLIEVFSHEPEVIEIGRPAFIIIGLSFISAVFSFIMPVFFQAIGASVTSTLLSLTRQIFCLMPIFFLLSLISLDYVWWAFPLSETIAGAIGVVMYFRQTGYWKRGSEHLLR